MAALPKAGPYLKKRLVGWKPKLAYGGVAVMLSMLPTLASYLGNRYQVSVQDLIVPIGVNLLTAALGGAVFYPLWKRDRPAAYVALTLALLIMSSNYDARISPLQPLFAAIAPMGSIANGPIFAIVATTAILALCWWLGVLAGRLVAMRKWRPGDVVGGIALAITVTFAFEFATLAKDLAVEWPQFFYKPPSLGAAPATAKSASKPDIYYLVMEDYASPDVLKKQFNFDDADFVNYLNDNQFYVNKSEHNNYPYTTMSVASTMSANYLNDIVSKYSKSSKQTVIPFNEAIRNSPVAAALKSGGYKYDLVGNWYETSNLSPLADHEYSQTGKFTLLGHTYTLNNYSKISLTQSIFARIVQMKFSIFGFTVWGYVNQGDIEMTQYQLQTLHNLAGEPAGGRFIYSEIFVPHETFFFNADGSLNPNSSDDNVGEPVKQKYVNSVQYINGQMKSLIDQINTKSNGTAVVVLLSDEGPYPFQLNDNEFDGSSIDGELQAGDMRKWSDNNLQMKYGTFGAYKVPAADLTDASTADKADPVNIFRLVLNSYLGYNLQYLPDCYYAYPDGRDKPQSFTSITTKLTGQPEDKRCHADGSVSP